MRQTTKSAAWTFLLVIALGIGACTTHQTVGSGTPANDTTTSNTAAQENTPSTGPALPTDPCDLLSPTEVEQFGKFAPPVIDDFEANGSKSTDCAYHPIREDTRRQLSIGVNIWTDLSVTDADETGLDVKEISFNGRTAARISDPESGCIIALAIDDTSRVDVGGSGVPAEEACPIAERVAEIIEPRLPKES